MRTDEQRRKVVEYLNRNPEQREKMRVRSRAAQAKKRAADRNYQARIAFYQELVEMQGSETCAICGTPPLGRRLSVDHDHETDEIRGLLCSPCNSILGLAKESPEVLLKAIDYLGRKQYTGRRFAELKSISVAYLYGGTRSEAG